MASPEKTSSYNTQQATPVDRPSKKAQANLALSECMFSQSIWTLGFVMVLGIPIGLRTRNYWPLVTAGTTGQVIDFAYGYKVNCIEQVAAFKAAMASSES